MEYAHSILTTASPERIWKMFTDVKNWKNWDASLLDADIRGDFETDAQGTLIPGKGPKSKFTITSCKPNFTYTMGTKLPLAQVYIRRLIGYHNKQTMITNEIWVEGPLGAFWWKLIGKKYLAMLPKIMDRFKIIAESRVD